MQEKQTQILSQQQISSQLQSRREHAIAASQAVSEGNQKLYKVVAQRDALSQQIQSLRSLNTAPIQSEITKIGNQLNELNTRQSLLEQSSHEIEVSLGTMKQQTDSINLRISILTNNIQLRHDISQLQSITVELES